MARWFDEKEAKRRQAEQEAARAHEAAQESLRPASEQKVKTVPLAVNLDKQTNQSAARVASRIPDETERDGFLNEYIAHVKKQKSPNHQKYAPSIGTMREMTDATVTGGVYADTRAKNEKQRLKEIETQKAGKTAMLELAEMPLMGFDGQSINANTADAATVIRGINAIADDTLRARAAKAFKTLTQTEGSRFYGENADGVGTFLESANLTRDEYRDATEDYASRFYGDGKHDKEDAAAYLKARQEIEESAYSDYAKSQLTAALDKAYTGITGGETPSESAGDEPAEAEDEARAPEEEQKKEKKPGFWSGLTGKVPEQEEQEKAENPAQAKAQSRIVSQTMTASTAPGFPTAAKMKAEESGKAPEVQGPVQMTPEERIIAQGGMSFAEWMATTPSVSSDGETGAEIRMHEAQTVGEAADALLKGRYDQIEGAGKDELDRMLAESGNARRMIGTLTEADSQRILLGNDMADAVTYGNIAAQGQTVKTLYDVMKSDSFPDELRGDVMAQMVVWAAQAEAMEKAGTLGGDAELPLMERLLTTDEHAMDELASIYAARDELLADKADMRRAQEEASAQALSDARTAALKGTASEEQLALVRQNAQAGQDELNADMGYVGRLAAVDDYFRPGASKNAVSPFDSSSVKLNLDAQGVIDTGDYQAQLREQMDALLEEDTQTALALGLTLDEYYAKTGGVDMNALCERAASRISQQGAAITDEEMAALDVPFGQGVGASYTVGAGIRAGGEQWYLDFKDSLYTGYSQGMVLVNAARIQNRYQNEYGAYGRTQYRKDIESALASGTLDENYANALRKALAGAADVYQLGIDPMDFEGDFLKNSAEVRRDIETMEGYMRTNATEDEFKWFGRVKGMTYNAVSAGVAAGTTLATGSSLIGFNTGYSVVGFKNNFDEYLQKGYSIDSARYLGAVNTGLDCASNFGTFEGVLGRMTGMSALTEAARSRIIRNPAGACRGLAAIRTFGEAFSKAFAQNEFDEVVHDEFFEGLSANWTDNALGEIFRKVDAGEDITFTDGLNMALNLLNPKNLDVKGAAEGVVSGAVENAIGAVLFSLSGAAGSGVGTLRGVKAAQDLMNGKRTDVENVILDVTKTLGDEQACALLNDYARQQKESKAVAEEIISGKDERGSAAHAAKAKQQADEARAQAEAAQTAADNSRAQFTEASDAVMNGDLTRQKEMAEARVRMGENQKTANEQGAVAARRTDEMQQAAAQRLAEARQAGRKAVVEEDAAAREAMLDDREARMQAIDNEIAQLDAQQQAAEEEFYAATQSYTEAEAMGMDEETLGQLDARMNEIGARLMALYDRREALQNPEAYEARRKAEAEIAEREQQAQMEASIGTVGADAGQEGVDQGGIKNPVFQKFSSVIGKHFGTQIVVADLGDGLRGHYDPQTNRLYISSRMGTGEAMRVVLCHELTHFIENGKGYGAYRDAVLQAAYRGDETAMRHDVERITEVYAPVYERDGRTFTPEDAQKELVARATETVIGKLADWTKTGGETQIYDLLGEKQRFGVRLYNSLTQFIARVKAKTAGRMDEYNDLVKARDALRTALMDAGKAAKEERRQYALDLGQDSHYDYSKSFAEQVEDWQNGKFPKNDALLVGRTPEVFRRIGLNDLPMTMNQTHVDYAVNGTKEDHQMSLVMLEHLPELLEHPVAIIESATRPNDSIVAIVDGTINGKNVIVPITIQTSSTANGVQIDANHLASAYGKKNAVNLLENALKKENADSVGVYYLDKNRASNLISDPRVQFPSISEKTGLIHSIFDAGGSVKQKNMEQTETRQFKRWFKDSKVVDEDGKPLIVYHGSDADFNAFDMTKGRANMDIQGAFFSPWDDDAAGYGGNVRAFYLSIQNPADEGTAYKALNRFKGQNEAGVKARKYLESLGYDGVNNSGEEYIAFYPEQIKSATDNVGLFDPMNPDTRYSLVLNQFGNVNAQKIDTLTDRIKQGLIGDAHEKQINREQVERANARYDQEGADALIADLASRDMWTADETIAAQVAMLRSQDEGYLVRALRIAQMYDDHRSKAGQALQAGNALKRLTASGAMAEMVRQADDANREKGVDEGNIPVGDSAPVKKQGRIYDTAETVQQKAQSAPNSDVVSADNPLHIPLSGAQTALIDHYGLWGTKLPGYDYFKASVKERQLAAIIATPNNNRGNGLLTLCQQLEFMKRGYAVVTEADLNYITGEMATYQLLEGDNETPQTPEGKTIIQRMYSAQANTKQNSAWQKFNNYGYDSMLSGSKTWNKNVMSNVLIRPLELTSEAIGSVADRMIAKKTGNRTTALSSKEGRQAGKQAFADEIANTLTDYIIRGVDTGHSSSFDMNHNNRTYNNAFMQAVHDFIAMAMQLGDRPFYEQSYQEELDAITRLETKIRDTRETADGYTETYLRDMTQEERHAEATRRATERVFQEDNAIIDAINRIKRENKGADMVITAIMPFLKTPTNVAIRSMQYSPIGLAYTVVKNGLIDAKMNNGVNFDQRKFVMNLGRGLTGTGMMVLGVALANMGLIRKGREDEDDAKLAAIEKSNGRSYGMYFDLGGIQIPLDFAFPAVAPLVTGAEVAESLDQFEGDFGAMAVDMNKRMAASSIDQLFDNSMLSGVSDVFRGYKDGAQIATSILEGVVENTASRLTPSAIRAFAKFTDPYVRDTKSQNYIRQVINQTIIQNWPLLRQTLPTAKTITGEEQLQTGANSWNKESQNAALHFLNSFITPWTAGSETSDALLDELVDIAYRKKETGWLPGQLVSGNKYEVSITKTLAKELKVGKVGFNQYEGFNIRLTDEEKRWANSTYADTLFNGSGRDVIGLRAMMSGNRWERMSDEERIEAVRDMQKTAKKQVLTELVRRKKEAGEIR
nr:MAG TPA: PolyVal ADP-Ribosyltransferase [Caudoviricetes sp.]